MGVYIYRSLYIKNWYKVGHQTITRKSPNVYFRLVGKDKDFNFVRHPVVLKGRIGINDVELVKWYPNLNLKTELEIHRILRKEFPQNYGEFYYLEGDDDFYRLIKIIREEFGGIEEYVGEEEREMALEVDRNMFLKRSAKIGHTIRLLKS